MSVAAQSKMFLLQIFAVLSLHAARCNVLTCSTASNTVCWNSHAEYLASMRAKAASRMVLPISFLVFTICFSILRNLYKRDQ